MAQPARHDEYQMSPIDRAEQVLCAHKVCASLLGAAEDLAHVRPERLYALLSILNREMAASLRDIARTAATREPE